MTMTSNIFKALSEPIRLRIMVMLTLGELCVCDLVELLGLPQSTVSRHMSRLKAVGLVVDRRAGKWVHYCIADDQSVLNQPMRGMLESLSKEPPHRDDIARLTEYRKTKSC